VASPHGQRNCSGCAENDAQTDNIQRNVLHSHDIALRSLLAKRRSPVKQGKCTPGCQRSRTVGPTTVRSQRTHLTNALRAATAAALISSFAFAGAATATADPTNTGSSAEVNTLAASLSKGYGLNNCTAQNITGGQLASLTCGQSPDPSGPVMAKYILFDNADDLAGSFKASIKDDVMTACGDSGQSPTTWHQGNSTTSTGSMACGTYQNGAEIIWTTDAKNILSYIRASNTDVPSLYQWWRANG
jgi:hypothetical protein